MRKAFVVDESLGSCRSRYDANQSNPGPKAGPGFDNVAINP